ncbi:MAG: ParB N-terminal domain-containing protein [Cytophagaceae bacterium]|nr:ParB N-terminal domain-containing protein [Cytophagaceae bacterium]MBL0323678.1 ParB N-terminal domain-containing protein [Cytophagaceae bacterium]
MQTQLVKVKDLKNNSGQIEGLPKNPRILKDDKFIKLKKSLQDDPEMLQLREVIAYDNNGELVVICGNMRLRALKELGVKEVPTKILPKETSVDKLRAYTIKDNVAFGEHSWDDLANEWDAEKLEEWGLDLPGFDVNNETEHKDLSGDLKETFEVIISCNDETHQEQVYNKMIADGFNVRVLTL